MKNYENIDTNLAHTHTKTKKVTFLMYLENIKLFSRSFLIAKVLNSFIYYSLKVH